MKLQQQFVWTLVAVCALAACGGGGGGGGTTTPTVTPVAVTPQVAITAGNAKAVTAAALEAVTNPFSLLAVAAADGAFNRNPTQSVLTQPQACLNGGTATIVGVVVNPAILAAGDRWTATYANCGVLSVSGNVLALSGSISSTVLSNAFNTIQYESSLNAIGLNILSKGFEFTGDQKIAFNAANLAALNYLVTGTSTKVRISTGGVVRNTIWQNYSQTIIAGTVGTSYSLSATIQTDNTNVAAASSTFVVNTTTPIVRSNSTGALTVGAYTVAGSNNSRLTAIVNADGSATIQVDANGDGVFETSLTSTSNELVALQ